MVIEGCLGIYHNPGWAGGTQVWRMEELDDKKKEWVKMMTLSPPCLSLGSFDRSLFRLEDGKVLFQKREEQPKTFYVYDPERNIIKPFPIDVIDGIRDWVPYSETWSRFT